MRLRRASVLLYTSLTLAAMPAAAGPPYATDDPEPTDKGHYEIYAFASGTSVRGDQGGAGGIDFNFGAADDLQLTMVVPLAWDRPEGAPGETNLGNIELAAKYKFLHQDDVGVDVAFFPRVFLPAGPGNVGERHVSLLLPLWIGRSWSDFSTFGGGGCVLNRGGDSQNFCQAGLAFTDQILPKVQLGTELVYRTADTIGGRASTALGLGGTFELTDNIHLMASVNAGIQNAATTNRVSWYSAILFTL